MATIPLELYELFEEKLGKEKAKEAIELVKEALETVEKKAKEQKTVVKAELKDELRKELATKEDIAILDQKMETVYKELDQKIETVRQEIETVRQELKGEIRELRVYMKFTIIIVVIGITVLNPNFTELVKSIISMLK